MTIWRLLTTPPARGAWNMAVDEAVLEAAGRGDVPATLRLYAWDPACLSLGYAQPFADVDTSRLRANGWDVVRRATGGRAILHTDELTYSVCAGPDEPLLRGSVLESYNRLARALLAAVRSLELPVTMEENAPAVTEGKGPVCFEVPSTYEIVVDGKKLIGSAQARRREGVLQHGTLPLTGDLGRITEALAFADEAVRADARARLLARATTIESALGRAVSWEQAAAAFRQNFAVTLDLELVPGELTAAERARAEELVQEKYAHPSWTERV